MCSKIAIKVSRKGGKPSLLKKINGNFTDTKEIEIKKMKEGGKIPSYESMFDDETLELVNEIYSDDLALFKKHFRKDLLLF